MRASAAMSLVRVAARPLRAKTRRAAATMASRRASRIYWQATVVRRDTTSNSCWLTNWSTNRSPTPGCQTDVATRFRNSEFTARPALTLSRRTTCCHQQSNFTLTQLHPLTLDQVLKLETVHRIRLELVATGTLPAKQYGMGAGECRCKTGMTTLVAE